MFLALFAVAAATMFQPAEVAQPNAMMLAQAHDRCMVGYAVRLTKTSASDEAIYTEAVTGCKGLHEQLGAAVAREYAPEQAAHLTTSLEAQAKPNFLSLVQRIRTDRLSKPGM
jgi:hypothetical protein